MFFANRLTRIVPLYLVLTTMVFIVASIMPHMMGTTIGSIDNYLKSLLFIPHFRQDGQLFPVLMPGWTLNFEMLFYLVIFIALFVRRQGFMSLVTLVLLLIYFFWKILFAEISRARLLS